MIQPTYLILDIHYKYFFVIHFDSGGVKFADLNEEQAFQFQKDLLLVALHMEQTYFNLATSDAKNGRNAIVLCDRGAMDASACLLSFVITLISLFSKHMLTLDVERDEWLRLLGEINKTEVELRDQRYDAVVHLVTAALGAESFYSNESNAVRSEGVELARVLDEKCKHAWIGHPYFDIIDNSTAFEAKCHRVVAALLTRLGLEDLRFGKNICKYKFLVEDAYQWDMGFPVSHQDFTVEHTFLNTSDGTQTRIRRRTAADGVSHFTLTQRYVSGLERRRPLSGREYEALRGQAGAS
jgi:hypothetical protein